MVASVDYKTGKVLYDHEYLLAEEGEYFITHDKSFNTHLFVYLDEKIEPEDVGDGPFLPPEYAHWKLHSIEGDYPFVVFEYDVSPTPTHAEATAVLRYLITYFGL